MIDTHLADENSIVTTPGILRQFAGLCLLFFGGLAGWQYFRHNRLVAALICIGLAVVLGLGGLIKPQAVRPVFGTAIALTSPIGRMVSRLVLILAFFGVVTPVALVFKLIGRDPLHRRYRPDATSYWTPKTTPHDMRSYFHQS
jgi:hypothetical protein